MFAFLDESTFIESIFLCKTWQHCDVDRWHVHETASPWKVHFNSQSPVSLAPVRTWRMTGHALLLKKRCAFFDCGGFCTRQWIGEHKQQLCLHLQTDGTLIYFLIYQVFFYLFIFLKPGPSPLAHLFARPRARPNEPNLLQAVPHQSYFLKLVFTSQPSHVL